MSLLAISIHFDNFSNWCDQLRSLQFVRSYGIFARGFTIASKNFPLLEEWDIYYTTISEDDAESVDRSYPLLKSLILNDTSFDLLGSPASEDNDKAQTISKNMSELWYLSFCTNNMTYEGNGHNIWMLSKF